MNWKDEASRLKRQAARPPKGCLTIEEIAREMGDISIANAQEMVNELIKQCRATRVRGKKLNSLDQLITAIYYKLIKRK